MRRALSVFVIAAMLGCVGVVEPERPALAEDVEGFLDSYLRAIEARDEVSLRNFYADDGRFVWIEDGKVRYRSAEDILAGLAALPSDAKIRTEYEDREVVPVGGNGARFSAKFRTVIGEGPGAFEFGGMMTMALERGPNGWRIVGGHTSSARRDGR